MIMHPTSPYKYDTPIDKESIVTYQKVILDGFVLED